jgi:ABC-type polysaccharide/polyol phosphate export permease
MAGDPKLRMAVIASSDLIDYFCLRKKFLVYNLVNRNLRIRYQGSFLGVLWTLITPLAMAWVYYFIFKIIFKVQAPHYLVYVLSGVIPWTFFSQTIMEGMESIVSNVSLLTRVNIPLQVFNYAISLTALINIFVALPVILGFAILSGIRFTPAIAFLPFYFSLILFFGYALSVISAAMYVFFRDLRHILGIVMQIWFYATPVLYQESMIPDPYRWILLANPVGPLFVGIRSVLIQGQLPADIYLIATLIWTLVIFTGSILCHKHFYKGLVELI